MKKFKMCLLAASGIAILAFTITLLNTSRAGAQQAVPRVTPKPPTPVDIVQSDITLPTFDIDNARQPFQASVRLALDNSVDLETIAMVPNDKRLVIEYISARGFLSGNGCFFNEAQLQTQVASGGVQSHYLVMNLLGTEAGTDSIFGFSQQARLYADPGTTVRARASTLFCSGGLQVTISGYFVDVSQFVDITP
jgi:hypothetical protein